MLQTEQGIALLENLMSPPAAQTQDSIALIWDKPWNAAQLKEYRVYADGACAGACSCTDYTLAGLEPSREYRVKVQGLLQSGEVVCESRTIAVRTKDRAETVSILDYGAVGDGETLNTEAIQSAIDACPHGGRVVVPNGVFVSGAIELKSNMSLYLEKGALLLGSENLCDYPIRHYRFEGQETDCYTSLINTCNWRQEPLENITIEGEGAIDASGSILRRLQDVEGKGKPGRAVCLRNVRNIYIKGVTIRQSPAWCVHLIYSQGITLNGVTIRTKEDEDGNRYQGMRNGDGFDPDSCKDVYVFHCTVASQDDCIAVKSGADEEGRRVGIPCENIRITNCSFLSGFGVAMGSDMAGGVRNVLVQDCSFRNVFSIASVKAPRGRGSCIENVRYEDIVFKNEDPEYQDCKWFRGAIYVDQFYGKEPFDPSGKEPVDDGTAVIRNIVFRNIVLDTMTSSAIYLMGLPEQHLQDIRFENVRAVGKYGMKVRNTDGLMLSDVCVEAREGRAYQWEIED